MAQPKSHLLYTKPPEGTETFRYSIRWGDGKDEEAVQTKGVDFTANILLFEEQRNVRSKERNPKLNVPFQVTYIDITFWGWFNSSDFDIKWRADFGLSPIKFTELNTRVLFAVTDEALFENFLSELRKYAEFVREEGTVFNSNVKYIKDFKFYGTNEILSSFNADDRTIYLNLVENLELDDKTIPLIASLRQYLEERKVRYRYNPEIQQFEIEPKGMGYLSEIAQNFDVVHSVNSHSHIITRPDRFGTNIKEYPFSISPPSDELPIIGIIDTGINVETPLSQVVIEDSSFGLHGMNALVDEADEGYGHGTSVAALAALGEQLAGNIPETVEPQARLLSIKILSDMSGPVGNFQIGELVRRAVAEHGIKIFNLSICYSKPLGVGEPHSDYAYMLDKLAYELDILICICTANGKVDQKTIHDLYPDHFLAESANFCTPADSMNNITVGALGDNLEPELAITATKYPFSSSEHPAAYTRKYHIDYESLKLKNRHVFKPDVVYAGGNYTCVNDGFGIILDSSFESALQILTAKRKQPIMRSVGTSFSTPLIANFAARIMHLYPGLRTQSIKALIINSTAPINFGNKYGTLKIHHKRFLAGYGKPDFQRCTSSDSNQATIIFEGDITVGKVKSLPFLLPEYLNENAVNNSVLLVEATLCFRFMPLQNNQLAYCPVNVAFGFFKNIPIVDDRIDNSGVRQKTIRHGISGGKKDMVTIGPSVWSQDAFGRSKLLSNTQQLKFEIKRDQIVNESNIVKVGVNAHYHKILPEYQLASIPKSYEYSLVLRISEIPNEDGKLSGRLYDELVVLNDLTIINDLESDAEVEGDATID